MNHLRLQHNRELLAGKTLIGIDSAKDKYQAAVVGPLWNERGSSYRLSLICELAQIKTSALAQRPIRFR
jgi:hypothetical protein